MADPTTPVTPAAPTDAQLTQTIGLFSMISTAWKSKTIFVALAIAVVTVGQQYLLSPSVLAPFLTQTNVAWVGGGVSVVMLVLRILTTQSLVDKIQPK